MNPPPTAGFALTLTAVLLWGAQLPIAKGAMVDIDGYTMTLIRYAVASIGLVALLVLREGSPGREAAAPLRARWPLGAAAGVFGMAASGLLVFVGLSMTRPEVAVIIIALQPAMTAIAQWLLTRRRPSPFTLACLVAAFLGVVIVVTRGGTGLPELIRTDPHELLGDALVFAGAAAWVAYTLMAERLRGWSSLRISAITCASGSVALLLVWFAALALGAASVPSAEILARHGWRLGYLTLLGVLAAMFLWNAGSRRIGALNAMLVLNLMPVVTFAVRALEGARFLASELVGAGIVIAALVANNLYARRRLAPPVMS